MTFDSSKEDGFNAFLGVASLIARNQLLTLATAVHANRKLDLEKASNELSSFMGCSFPEFVPRATPSGGYGFKKNLGD